MSDTRGSDYTGRLVSKETAAWKRVLNVQLPYKLNVQRACPGRVLDLGCGIGRNLAHLDGRGVGIDHNASSIQVARQRGFEAYTPEEFKAEPGSFDSMLAAHVLEHLSTAEADDLVASYLPYVRKGGRVVLICPQERGYASDATHVRFVDLDELAATAARLGLTTAKRYSFPLPRFAGKAFTYNEFVLVATV